MSGVQRVAVVGAGTMGYGFAVHFARHGRGVALVDHREANLDRARDQVREAVAFLNEEGAWDRDPEAVAGEVTFTLDRPAAVADADLVLETVSEDLEVKGEVFRGVAANAPDDAVLATNTSGIPVTEIQGTVPEAADRVVGCHWWNPPYLMPTVEVVRGEETSDETAARARAFVEDVDRTPVAVERDVPGFVWNRIQFAVVREATHLVEAGVASVEDVEAAVRDGYALRTAAVGPFETMDLAGLDLFETVGGNLLEHLSDADEPSHLFEEHLEAGRGGVEDAGFREYDREPGAVRADRDRTIAAVRRARERVRERERDD